jgi:hypothetical protein
MPRSLLLGTSAASLGLSRHDGACVHPFEQSKESSQHGHWGGRAAGDVEVDRDNFRDPSNDRVAADEAAAIARAISDCDDPFGIRDGMIGALQGVAHVLGHGPGHHQYIGMARRGNKPEAEALDVVVGVVKRVNFEFAPIARSGVDLAYGETSAETSSRSATNGGCEFGHGGIVRRRRLLGEWSAKQAFKKQLAHLVLSLEILA